MSYEAFKQVGHPTFAKITIAAAEAFPGEDVIALVSPRVFGSLASDLTERGLAPGTFIYKPHRILLPGCPEIYAWGLQADSTIVLIPARSMPAILNPVAPLRIMTEVTLP